MARLTRSHQPCPDCGSSDALAMYDDDHTYCFSCGVYNSTQVEGEDALDWETQVRGDKNKSLTNQELIKYFPLSTKNHLTNFQPSGIIEVSKEEEKRMLREGKVLISEGKKESNNISNTYVKEESVLSTEYVAMRGINVDTMRKYKILTNVSQDGTPVSIMFPYGVNNSKVRSLKEKQFWWAKKEEELKEHRLPLFGMDQFEPGSAKSITITEGEFDALAAYQMQGSKYPVVSVSSAGAAENECKQAFKYLNSFDNIYLNFDNDNPGVEATLKVARLFNPNKVFLVPHERELKDANAYLEAKKQAEYIKLWWSSTTFKPKNIINRNEEVKGIIFRDDAEQIATYPFPDLDGKAFGIRSSEVVLITAPEKVGKALCLTTPLPTPTGWTTVGDLNVGDTLLGRNGEPTKVTYITPVQYNDTYVVTFQDGTSIKADGPHRWTVRNLEGKESVVDTETMYRNGVLGRGSRANYMIPVHKPCTFEEAELPIDPFILGVWLADGHSYSAYITLSPKKLDILKGYKVRKIYEYEDKCLNYMFDELTYKQLSHANLIKNKHIPSAYLRSSIEQRTQLMKGMMFDGWQNEFYTGCKELLQGFLELARSLGYTCKVRDRDGYYTVRFKLKEYKAIRKIERVKQVPTKCLTVDSDDHLFIAGDGWNLTHNTEILRAMEHHLLKTTPYSIGVIHLEESERRAILGLINYEVMKPVHLPHSGVSKQEMYDAYEKMVGHDNRVNYYTHFGSDDPDVILDSIRYMVAVQGCKFLFLDHITMLVTGYEGDDERRKLDYISTRLAMMTRELDFTLFLISHVNDDGKTRGSRNISKIADLILHMERDIEAKDDLTRNTTQLVLKGNRFSGQTGPVAPLFFDTGSYTLRQLNEEDVLKGAIPF